MESMSSTVIRRGPHRNACTQAHCNLAPSVPVIHKQTSKYLVKIPYQTDVFLSSLLHTFAYKTIFTYSAIKCKYLTLRTVFIFLEFHTKIWLLKEQTGGTLAGMLVVADCRVKVVDLMTVIGFQVDGGMHSIMQ